MHAAPVMVVGAFLIRVDSLSWWPVVAAVVVVSCWLGLVTGRCLCAGCGLSYCWVSGTAALCCLFLLGFLVVMAACVVVVGGCPRVV